MQSGKILLRALYIEGRFQYRVAGVAEVDEGAGLKILFRRDSRVQIPSPASSYTRGNYLFEIMCLSDGKELQD